MESGLGGGRYGFSLRLTELKMAKHSNAHGHDTGIWSSRERLIWK